MFVSNLYPPFDLGGMELRCEETVSHLRARGHVCYVLTSKYGVQGQPIPEDGVSRTLHLDADIHYYRPLDFFLRRHRQDRENGAALRAALDSFRPDLVFVWGMWNLSPQVAYWAEQWIPGRVAYTIASYWPMEKNAHEAYWSRTSRRAVVRKLMAPARKLALRELAQERAIHPLAMEQVTCVSAFVRGRLLAAGVLPHGARVIYNGIDPRPFKEAAALRLPRPEALRLVYTGGIVAHKGVHTAVDALGLLKQRGNAEGLYLTLVGGGHPDYEARLRRRVGELGLETQITFRGRVPRDEIAAILAAHDVFLFTPVWPEPIARTVMEAMASGLTVIGTQVGGQCEILEDGVNALVFAAEDAAGLAERISKLKASPQLAQRLAEAGRATVIERFTLDRMVAEIETWLHGIVGDDDEAEH